MSSLGLDEERLLLWGLAFHFFFGYSLSFNSIEQFGENRFNVFSNVSCDDDEQQVVPRNNFV